MRISHLRPCLSLLGCFFSATLLHAATVTTLPATNITGNSATLNAVANPGGQFVFGYFEYGTTASYGTRTTEQNLGSGTSNTNFSQLITGLTGGQAYHFRADVANVGLPLATGTDQTFFVPLPPQANTLAAVPIHPGEAQLNATINPFDLPTAYWFQYGLTTSYGSFTPTNTLPAGTNVIPVNALLTGLIRGTNYHYCIVATNALGRSTGSDQSFAIPAGATVPSGSTGGGAPFNLGEPSTAVNFLICTQGIYQGSPPAFPLIGAICLFAGNFAPAGWCLCQGQLLNVNSNATLFNLIGTTYGGDGQTTFALPDFRGCRAVHVGTGWILSQRSSSTQTTLTVSQLPVHTHSLPAPYNITGIAGSGQPFGIDQPYLVINYMMALEGLYPQSAAPVSEPFLGQIFLFAPNLLPSGYSFLNGQALSVNQNAALYSLMGTNYGGNGQTTFNEPNLQARSPLGAGQGPFTLRSLAQVTGADIETLSPAQMPAHQHAAPTLGTLTGSAGSNQPISLMNPSLVLQYLISTNGQIPSPTIQAANAMMGEIELYAGTNLPGGWLPCDGRSMPVASNPGLFSVISNFFGGDGITTFALPNLAGRTAIGAINGQPGASFGAEQAVLTTANLPPHTHSIPIIDYDFWITSYNLSGAAAGFSANADADAAANGYEWATGTNPTNSQSLAPLTINSASGYAMVNFPRNTNATDVIFTLQRSTNLANSVWTGVATNISGIWSSPATVAETGSTNPVTVTVSTSLTNGPTSNYRLQITWP